MSMQEAQLSRSMGEPEVLQKWRVALFKEMVVRKDLQLLVRAALVRIQNEFV